MPQARRSRPLLSGGRFNLTPAHVGFMLEEVVLGTGFSLGTLFLIPSVLDTHVIHLLLKLHTTYISI
jgi:hypothetical protein